MDTEIDDKIYVTYNNNLHSFRACQDGLYYYDTVVSPTPVAPSLVQKVGPVQNEQAEDTPPEKTRLIDGDSTDGSSTKFI